MSARAQTFTLEAVIASLLLVGAVAFAVAVSGVTPLTGSASSQRVPGEEVGVATGTLDAALADDRIRETLLYWNASGATFYSATDDGYYVDAAPSTRFGRLLTEAFDSRDVALNVNVVYLVNETNGPNRTLRRQPLLRQGTPSSEAVRATRVVTLYDDDNLTAPGGETNATLTETAFCPDASASQRCFYAPDVASGPVYNVVRVEVVAWRV